MSRLLQIYESDLADLERIVPQIADAAVFNRPLTPTLKTHIRRVQTILTNVRWNYGPPEVAEKIPCDGGDDDQ